jgi:hypothetical protein
MSKHTVLLAGAVFSLLLPSSSVAQIGGGGSIQVGLLESVGINSAREPTLRVH